MDDPSKSYTVVEEWSITGDAEGKQRLVGISGGVEVKSPIITNFISKSNPKSALTSGDVIIAGGEQYMIEGKAKGQK